MHKTDPRQFAETYHSALDTAWMALETAIIEMEALTESQFAGEAAVYPASKADIALIRAKGQELADKIQDFCGGPKIRLSAAHLPAINC